MNETIGKVIEVFIPNNNDIMNSNMIGFKILINDNIIEIIEEQDEINSNILKDDIVQIIKEEIDGINYITIEKYDGEYYE